MATGDGILVVSAAGVVLFSNPAAAQLLGRTRGQLQDLPFGFPLVGGERIAELDVALPDGKVLVVEMHAAPIRWRGVDAQVLTLRDVTDRVAMQRRLQASEARYELIAAAVNDGLWDWKIETGLVHTSARLLDMLSLPLQERDEEWAWWWDRVHLDDRDSLEPAAAEHKAGLRPRLVVEVRLRCNDGTWLWVLVRGLAVWEEGQLTRFAGSVTDISARKQAEDALRKLALHDPLTGLPNRALILDRLSQAIGHLRRIGGPGFALLFLDLDEFKLVNDNLGHAAGDALLVEVARRLEHSVRATDTVGRLGGDEFVVLLEAPIDADTVLKTVQRIQDAVAAPIGIGENVVQTSASIGVLLSDDASIEPEIALRNADIAMYAAKTDERNSFRIFTAAMQHEAFSQRHLRTTVQDAVINGALSVRYQQIVDLADGRPAAEVRGT